MAFDINLKPLGDDLDQAQLFTDTLHGNEALNWRCIHGQHKTAKAVCGKLDGLRQSLNTLNQSGFNVFITLNQTDGVGAAASNIVAVTALFADLDGVPIENIAKFPFKPTFINETSPGKYHAIYRVDGLPLNEFSRCQSALAGAIGSDPSVCDLPRVVRVPGFLHTKNQSAPFLSRMVHFDPEAIHNGSEIINWVNSNQSSCATAENIERQPLEPIERLGVVEPGNRNSLLTRYVGKWFAQGKSVEEVQILADQVNRENFNPSLPETEVDAIVSSINNRDLINHSERRSLIQFFNDNYCLVTLGGKAFVLRECDQTFLDVSAFKAFHLANVNYDEQPTNLWLKVTNRRYLDYVFDPSGEVSQQIYNSFKGWPVAPKPGSCDLYLDHIKTVICDGDEKLFNYVFSWMAHLLQKPTDKPGVALVLLGGQGIGKGEFVKHFAHLLGPYFGQISDISHLVGQFNSHLMNNMLNFVDEALWGKDKKNEGKLKALISEKTLTFERKYVEAMQKKNYSRFIFASNEEHAVPMATDDRRMVAMNVSEARKNDHAYFKAIKKQMQMGGYEALMHELLNRDLSEFEIRKKPTTAGSVGQKLHSLPSVEWWWYNVLQDGSFRKLDDYSGISSCPFEEFTPSTDMLDGYLFSRKNDPYRHGQVSGCNDFVTRLIKLCPSIERKRRKAGYSENRVRGLQVPDLSTCRREFEQKTNMVGLIDWDDDNQMAHD